MTVINTDVILSKDSQKSVNGFRAVSGCRTIEITDFICVLLKTMKKTHLCSANMKKNMVLVSGMIFTINIL